MALPAAGAAWTAWAAWAAEVAAYALTAFSVVSAFVGTKRQQTLADNSRGYLINTCDSRRKLPLLYGKGRLGINRVFTQETGSDNKYLHIIGNLCEGEINGIAQVDGVEQVWINDKLWNEFEGKVYYEFFTGSSTQTVCTTLYNAMHGQSSNVQNEWDDPKHYMSYIYVRLKFDMDLFQSLPDITVELEGCKIYNPVTAVTEYSRNPAWILRDFITRTSVRGGMGIDTGRINEQSFIDAATYCDTKGWYCDYAIYDDATAQEFLEEILSTFRGALIYSMTEYVLKYRDMNYESAVMAITEDDIISGSLRVTQPDVFNTPNAIEISYCNSAEKYQTDTFTFSDPDAIVLDKGDYREKSMSLMAISDESNVQKMAYYHLERLRQNKEADLNGAMRLLALDPIDLITLTHSRYGWEDKYFRVTEATYAPDGDVSVSLIEEDIRFYDDIYNLSDRTWHDTYLVGPGTAVPSVRNVTLTEEQYDYRGRTFTRLKVDFDGPAEENYAFWEFAEIWVKVGATGTYKFMTRATTDYMLDPVQEYEQYSFKLVSVSIWGTRQADADAFTISTTVTGRTTIPSDVGNFSVVVAGDTITIRANPLPESDIACYELRLGSTWRGGLYLGANETPNFRFVGVRPGAHTFWLAAQGNNGYYSANPEHSTATVYYPPGYVDIPSVGSWAWDYDAIGTFENTEHTTHSAQDALMCSHLSAEIEYIEDEATGEAIETEAGAKIEMQQTAGGLVGTWLSPEYDLGSVMTVRVWGDFLFDFINSSSTWDSIFPGSTTWYDRITSTTTWDDLLSNNGFGVIEATIYWGDTSGNLTNSADGFELLAAEFSARYIQVKITLTDPNYESNMYLYTLNMKAAYWS